MQKSGLTSPDRGETAGLPGAFVLQSLVHQVLELAPEDQMKRLDDIDQACRALDPQNVNYLATLGVICSAIGRLPTSSVLSSGLQKPEDIAVASGGFSDIWRGDLNAVQVAMKAFRLHARGLEGAKKILWTRIPIWRRLHHPNVLPLRGVNTTYFQLALVYDWGEYGNITQYVASNSSASRPSLLFDVANGLEYLHDLGIPHGNLKGTNVVIDSNGHARLTEYGLAPINTNPSFVIAATPGSTGTSRWLAPELITPPPNENTMPVMETKAADVFAFGMLAVEVFTGEVPFVDQRWNEAVTLHISRGGRPKMPRNAHAVGLTVKMWELLESCWKHDPEKRPTMREVVSTWRKFVEKGAKSTAFSEEPRHMVGSGECNDQRRTIASILPSRTEAIQPRAVPETVRRRSNSEAIQLGSIHGIAELRTEHNTQISTQVPRSEATLQHPMPRVPQPSTEVLDPPPGVPVIPKGFRSKIFSANTPARTRKMRFCGLF